jgi:hypothetical protein
VGRLRLVVGTDRESSADLRALGRELLAGIQSLDLKAIDPRGVELTGQMLYWTRVIDAITETFLSTFLGSLVLAFFCFLLITRRIGVAALAMIPNLLPLLAMFGFATLCGFTMNENLCFLVALSLGISVDDTLHFLHHYLLACRRGASTDRALVSALRTVGAPIVITSVLLVVGFLLCLAADILSIAVIGLLVVVSVVVALFADLLWMPSLLLLLGENSTSGEKVETAEGNPGFHP